MNFSAIFFYISLQDEQIVSYSMPYFRELGKVLQGTNKTYVHCTS